MTTKRKTISAKKYQRYTCAQLTSLTRKCQAKYIALCKAPEWKTTKGKTVDQQRTAVLRELRLVAVCLRTKTVQAIDAKLKALKTQMAKRLGVAIKSSKVNSAAVKRLTIKRRTVYTCTKIAKLVTICKGLKISSYKNPKAKASVKKTTSKKTTARKVSTGTVRTTKRSKTTVSKTITAKYQKQTKTLKKEIQKLQLRNSFMRKQVAKFRKDAAQLQRHYGTLSSNKPTRNVVNLRKVDQDVSNIVRFSTALSKALLKKQQRKAG